MAVQHWGEYIVDGHHIEALRPEEIKQLTRPQQAIVVEGPKLFQPPEPQPDTHSASLAFQMDPAVVTTLQLEQQNGLLSQALAQGTQLEESSLLPLTSTECFSRLEDTFNIFPQVTDSEFSRGVGVPIPEIPVELCRDLMVRSVAALAAHAGFHTSTDGTLAVLADAAGDFLRSLCIMLRRTRDMEAERGPHGFADALERALVDAGAGSLRQLVSSCSSCVLERLRAARDANYQLRAEYDRAAADRQQSEHITLDDSLLVDILAETPAALSSVGPGGTIDMSAYPNMSFESADDLVGMNSSMDSEEIVVQSSPALDAAAASPPNKKLRL